MTLLRSERTLHSVTQNPPRGDARVESIRKANEKMGKCLAWSLEAITRFEIFRFTSKHEVRCPRRCPSAVWWMRPEEEAGSQGAVGLSSQTGRRSPERVRLVEPKNGTVSIQRRRK